MDSPPETTHLSPVSPKTPTLLPGKSKGSKILPTTPCYPYSVQVSLLYLDFCVNWKTWETSKLIFMFSSSLIESVQEEALILKKEVFSTLPVKIPCPYTSSPLLPFLQISKCPLLPAASISFFLLVPSPVSWHAQIHPVFRRNKNSFSSAS